MCALRKKKGTEQERKIEIENTNLSQSLHKPETHGQSQQEQSA